MLKVEVTGLPVREFADYIARGVLPCDGLEVDAGGRVWCLVPEARESEFKNAPGWASEWAEEEAWFVEEATKHTSLPRRQ